jgi:hypothetical protein
MNLPPASRMVPRFANPALTAYWSRALSLRTGNEARRTLNRLSTADFERPSAAAAARRDFPSFSTKSKSCLSSSGDQGRSGRFFKSASSKCQSLK